MAVVVVVVGTIVGVFVVVVVVRSWNRLHAAVCPNSGFFGQRMFISSFFRSVLSVCACATMQMRTAMTWSILAIFIFVCPSVYCFILSYGRLFVFRVGLLTGLGVGTVNYVSVINDNFRLGMTTGYSGWPIWDTQLRNDDSCYLYVPSSCCCCSVVIVVVDILVFIALFGVVFLSYSYFISFSFSFATLARFVSATLTSDCS